MPLSSLCVWWGALDYCPFPFPLGSSSLPHCRAGGEQPEEPWSNQGSPCSAFAALVKCSSHSPQWPSNKAFPSFCTSPLCAAPPVSQLPGEGKNRYKTITYSFSTALALCYSLIGLKESVPALSAITPLTPGTWYPAHTERFMALIVFAVIRRECKKTGANELDGCQSLTGCEERYI